MTVTERKSSVNPFSPDTPMGTASNRVNYV
jgi:hypothetical protein